MTKGRNEFASHYVRDQFTLDYQITVITKISSESPMEQCSDALGVPVVIVVIGGGNLPSPIGIGLTDLPNIRGASGPLGPLGSGIIDEVV